MLDGFLASRGEKRTGNESKASMVAAVIGEETLVSRVTAVMVDAYISTRRQHRTQRDEPVTDHTICKELAVLRAALTLAKRRGNWAGDLDAVFPSSGDFSAGYDPKKSGERALSRRDVGALHAWGLDHRGMTPKQWARERERREVILAIISYAIATGSEMAALERARWDDIAADRRTVHVRGTKNDHREADVPIATLEQAWLLDYATRYAPGSGDLMFPASVLSNVRRGFARASAGAGVHHFSPHNVRHTLAQWLVAGGVHSAIVGRSLRHADGRMVESTYGHLRGAEEVRSAIEAQYTMHVSCNTERFLSGIGDADGTNGDPGEGPDIRESHLFADLAVPGPGIEPGTRGFSIPCSTN